MSLESRLHRLAINNKIPVITVMIEYENMYNNFVNYEPLHKKYYKSGSHLKVLAYRTLEARYNEKT